jgi:diketogulonate reductase-like aldo/keto reductase
MSLLPATSPTRTLGPGGKVVSSLAWGMWRFTGDDVGAAQGLVEAAFAAGITLFDTADIYGFNGSGGFGDAEVLLGKVFKAAPGLREKMVLATKGGIMPPLPYDQSRDYLTSALDASLTRLGVDHVDLWQVHRPDVLTHPQELARSLEDMVKSGKVGAVGVSNFTQAQVESLHSFLSIPLATTQPEISALAIDPIENGLIRRCDLALPFSHGHRLVKGGSRIRQPSVSLMLWKLLILSRPRTGCHARRRPIAGLWRIRRRSSPSSGRNKPSASPRPPTPTRCDGAEPTGTKSSPLPDRSHCHDH